MSTRGNICIKLRDEDLNKDFHMKDINGKNLPFTVHTASGFPYMYVYCHHDSYVSGLGEDLAANLITYEEVRDYILQGDRTSFNEPYTEYGESAEDNQPNFAASVDGKIPEEYFYLYDNDTWYVKTCSKYEKFEELEYKPKKIELNEREIEAVKFVIDKYLSIRDILKDSFAKESSDIILINKINDIKKKINPKE